MAAGNDRLFFWDGCLYAPLHSVPLAAGIFLPLSGDSIDQHVGLPPEHEFRHGVRDHYVAGERTHRPHIFAARIRGNSMMERNVLDGDYAIVQQSDFAYPEYGRIVVVERLGDEEGMGAWTLKYLDIEQPPASRRNEFGDDIDFENASLRLRPYNPQFQSWLLDPAGQYRVRGILLRSLRSEAVHLMDSQALHRIGTQED